MCIFAYELAQQLHICVLLFRILGWLFLYLMIWQLRERWCDPYLFFVQQSTAGVILFAWSRLFAHKESTTYFSSCKVLLNASFTGGPGGPGSPGTPDVQVQEGSRLGQASSSLWNKKKKEQRDSYRMWNITRRPSPLLLFTSDNLQLLSQQPILVLWRDAVEPHLSKVIGKSSSNCTFFFRTSSSEPN